MSVNDLWSYYFLIINNKARVEKEKKQNKTDDYKWFHQIAEQQLSAVKGKREKWEKIIN